jgi:hypothetical protein
MPTYKMNSERSSAHRIAYFPWSFLPRNQAGLGAVRMIFSIAGVAADTRERDAAKALIAFLASSAAVTVVTKTGLEPMTSAKQG